MLTILFLAVVALFALAYRFHGRFLDRRFEVDSMRPTPARAEADGVDRIAAPRWVLLGHHFSSIAGAGPIVGPIIAATAYGVGPPLLWIVLGAIFVGGVHDYAALMASIRHHGRSIADIAREHLSPLAWRLLLLFVWLTLVYVLTVFADLTSATFTQDGGVATASLLFVVLAVALGVLLYRFGTPLGRASLVFVPLVFLAVWVGHLSPLDAARLPVWPGGDAGKTWTVILLVYCFLASVAPVWLLLQPRDYLSSYLLYASVIGGLGGVLLGRFELNAPWFKGWSDPQIGPLIPFLFITVACGACSGFHSLVASGTSSKQLRSETDARPVAYGAMLIEGLVAVIALIAVAIVPAGSPLTGKPPLQIYAQGMGRFLAVFGIPQAAGAAFGLLTLSTFVLTTLDTATRLARYVFEEFFGLRDALSRYGATLATLVLPATLALITLHDAKGNPIPAWKAIWPVFGATNQLLAALALAVLSAWLRQSGRRTGFVVGPMLFMLLMTLWALLRLIAQYRLSSIGVIAAALFVLAALVLVEAVRTWRRPCPQTAA